MWWAKSAWCDAGMVTWLGHGVNDLHIVWLVQLSVGTFCNTQVSFVSHLTLSKHWTWIAQMMAEWSPFSGCVSMAVRCVAPQKTFTYLFTYFKSSGPSASCFNDSLLRQWTLLCFASFLTAIEILTLLKSLRQFTGNLLIDMQSRDILLRHKCSQW